MIIKRSLTLLACYLCLCPSAQAEETLTGYAAIEHRQFFKDPSFPGQELNSGLSLVLEPEYYSVSDDDESVFTYRPFIRLDNQDPSRTHADIRQFDWVKADHNWEIRAGVSKVFWGVTESQHLVDIINQTDTLEDTDGEDKLGQPLIQIATFQDWGTLRFYYLPYFRERPFTGKEGRFRSSINIERNTTEYTHKAKEWHPDTALRYEHTIGDWDIGIVHFHGTSREPRFNLKNNRLVPTYEVIDQSSIDLQYTYDAWLLKLEAIGRGGHGDYFGAAVGGFEYTWFTLLQTDYDLGILAEYHHDGRSTTNAPSTTFNNDFFIGSRFTLNDIYDTQLLGGLIIDTDDQSTFYFVEGNRRLNDHWKAEFTSRFFVDIDPNQPAFSFKDDNFMQLQLARYF